ncbi:MAG: hypothetical protein AABZ30_12815 [Myxococcota bacterium]
MEAKTEAKMEFKIEDGKLIITIPVNPEPAASASGKTLMVATTRGNARTGVMVNGQELYVGVNAYIYPPGK